MSALEVIAVFLGLSLLIVGVVGVTAVMLTRKSA